MLVCSLHGQRDDGTLKLNHLTSQCVCCYLIETRFLRISISLRILIFRNLYVLTFSKTIFGFKWSPSWTTRACLLLQCTIYRSVKWKVWGHLLWWHHPFILMLACLNTGKCKSKAEQKCPPVTSHQALYPSHPMSQEGIWLKPKASFYMATSV